MRGFEGAQSSRMQGVQRNLAWSCVIAPNPLRLGCLVPPSRVKSAPQQRPRLLIIVVDPGRHKSHVGKFDSIFERLLERRLAVPVALEQGHSLINESVGSESILRSCLVHLKIILPHPSWPRGLESFSHMVHLGRHQSVICRWVSLPLVLFENFSFQIFREAAQLLHKPRIRVNHRACLPAKKMSRLIRHLKLFNQIPDRDSGRSRHSSPATVKKGRSFTKRPKVPLTYQ